MGELRGIREPERVSFVGETTGFVAFGVNQREGGFGRERCREKKKENQREEGFGRDNQFRGFRGGDSRFRGFRSQLERRRLQEREM